jgi:polyisoprenoid-binding protein YceI
VRTERAALTTRLENVMRAPFLTVVALKLALVSFPAVAAAQKYVSDGDTRFVNIAFESRMDIEDILGTTKTASGSVELAGEGGSFDIKVPVASLRTGIDLRDEHLRSPMWLNGAKFPDIAFRGANLRKTGADAYEVSGKFTLHGVERPLTVPVEAKQIPAATGKKLGLPAGDWLRVRTTFKVKLSDHGIKIPDMTAAKVSNEWTVRVSLFFREVH